MAGTLRFKIRTLLQAWDRSEEPTRGLGRNRASIVSNRQHRLQIKVIFVGCHHDAHFANGVPGFLTSWARHPGVIPKAP
jgi:hypothetical protein